MKYLKRGFWIAIAALIFNSSDLPSCGPDFPDAVFTENHIPPLPDYFQGNLGVLQHTYWHKYLFVAFRYLSDQPLTEKEIRSLLNASNTRAEPESMSEFSASYPWLAARKEVPNSEPILHLESYRNDTAVDQWRYFANCSHDAYETAAGTLKKRIQSFGIGHPGIRSWLKAQDQVFSNCEKGETIPVAADPQLPQVFQYDRAYQIAAAHFYAEHYDTAAAMFDAIAADSASPWSELAPYLAVRCLIRKATVTQKYAEFDRNALQEADRKLKAILKDKRRATLHSIAAKLEAFVAIRLNPLDRIRSLAIKLERPTNAEGFEQDLIDYQFLLDRINVFSGLSPDGASKSSEMTDWILKFSSSDAAYCIERWKATKSKAWMLAAVVKLRAGDPEAADLLDAVQRIPKNSPAFATAQYHRIRLMTESGKTSEARSLLDGLLPTLRSTLQNSSLNLFLAQRFQLARNFDEFLEFAPRIPQSIRSEFDTNLEQREPGKSTSPLFDDDSIEALNRALPLRYLSRAATSRLPLQLRMPLLSATWMRAILFSDSAIANKISDELEKVFPDLKADLKPWREAKDAESKEFASVMLMLHFPGMSPNLQSGLPRREKLGVIDSFRDNWWCRFYAGNADFPSFLSDSDIAEFKVEWKKLSAVPTAPNYFAKIVTAWAEKHPKDERVPEALHLTVKTSRFGCTDWETGKYSRKAFQLLHSKYQDSEWTKKTPYWFK
jgi:hypothetical protein